MIIKRFAAIPFLRPWQDLLRFFDRSRTSSEFAGDIKSTAFC